MNKGLLSAVLLLLSLAAEVGAFDFQQNGRMFTVSGKRIKLFVRDAAIVRVVNKENNVPLAEEKNRVDMYVSGLGNMTGNADEMSRTHFPWGEPAVKQNRERRKSAIYGKPCGKSRITVEKSRNSASVTWQGLDYNGTFKSMDHITLTFTEDAAGALVLQRSGGGRTGIFGISVPVKNLSPDGKVYIPSFGGLEFAASSQKEEFISLQDTTLFIEAPLMIYVRKNNAFGMWIEDATFRPYFGMLERDKNGCSIALESQNIMPYEPLKKIAPPAVKFDVFSNAGWIAAARPYRNWYFKAFAKEIAIRDAKSWADDIYVIADGGNSAPGFENLLKYFKQKNVLIQIWQARKQGFTKDIPDYTPRGHYPGLVKTLHKHGFKVMCYVCPLCAVYKCPAWERDNVGSFFLTRKNSIANYHGNENAFDENLAGTIRAAKGDDQYGHLKPGAFLYGDPLSPQWREYFSKVIKEMNDICGTDANYQDTLGCTADVGNGYVNGISGAQGNLEFTRTLQQKVGVPMAAEFGPAPIAMGIRWPLNGARAWGRERFQKHRNTRQVPLSPFIFGYRTWVSSIRLHTDLRMHIVMAVSDALSGFGMISTAFDDKALVGYNGQMLLRARLFADKQLKPYYPEKIYPENVKAMYKDKDGKIYQYVVTGTMQKMVGPDKKAVYGRLYNSTELTDPEFCIMNHPSWDENGIYGLDKDKFYALYPRSEQSKTKICVGKIPAGIAVRSYYEMPEYAYLELDCADRNKEFTLQIKADKKYKMVLINGEEKVCTPNFTYRGKMPLRACFFTGKEVLPRQIILVNGDTGQREGSILPLSRPRKIMNKNMYNIGAAKKMYVNMLAKVPAADSAIELSLVNLQKRFGDGSIVELFINGELVKSFNCARWSGRGKREDNNSVFDNKMRTWKVPVGRYAGKFIFVSAAVDYKSGSNADQQFITMPAFIRLPKQKMQESVISPVDKKSTLPAGKPLGEVKFQWKKSNGTKDKGAIYSTVFKLDPEKSYGLSGKFRSLDGKNHRVVLGMIQYDARGQIHGVYVNPAPESYSMLSHVAKKGDTHLMVFDASQWGPGGMVALNAAKDESDLPNRNLIGPVKSVKLMGGDYQVDLASPLKMEIPSETKLRLHWPRETFENIKVVSAGKDFVSAAGTIEVLPKALRGALILTSSGPIAYEDVKLVEYSVRK